MPKQSKYVLKQGHSGELVEALQERLSLRVDGVFGLDQIIFLLVKV